MSTVAPAAAPAPAPAPDSRDFAPARRRLVGDSAGDESDPVLPSYASTDIDKILIEVDVSLLGLIFAHTVLLTYTRIKIGTLERSVLTGFISISVPPTCLFIPMAEKRDLIIALHNHGIFCEANSEKDVFLQRQRAVPVGTLIECIQKANISKLMYLQYGQKHNVRDETVLRLLDAVRLLHMFTIDLKSPPLPLIRSSSSLCAGLC
jgi:hypothetical protein